MDEPDRPEIPSPAPAGTAPEPPRKLTPRAYRLAKERAVQREATVREKALLATLTAEERKARLGAVRERSRERLAQKSQEALADLVKSGSFYVVLDANLRFLRSRRAGAKLTAFCLAGAEWAWRLRVRLLELTLRHDETLLAMMRAEDREPRPVEIKAEWARDGDKM